jgi:hypothetical protein
MACMHPLPTAIHSWSYQYLDATTPGHDEPSPFPADYRIDMRSGISAHISGHLTLSVSWQVDDGW